MAANPQEVQALIGIMNRQYEEIREIESEFRILGQEGDFRPRIDYFHDAVRSLTSGAASGVKHGRLSVERLAYDVAMLRHIQEQPLQAGRGDQHLSPHQEVATTVHASASAPRPDREARMRLSELYKDYTVLFTALFAEKADRDAQTRTEEANMLVEECAGLEAILEQFQQGKVSLAQVKAAIQQLEHDDLHQAMQALLSQASSKDPKVRQAIATLKQAMTRVDQEISTIQQASMNYSLGQLAVYENSKETVKRLASQGMNLAGKFVQNAMQQAQGKGRGF